MKEFDVWLIDDDEMQELLVLNLLQNICCDFKVQLRFKAHHSALKAWYRLKQMPTQSFPSVILLDLSLPDFDGFDFLKAYQKYFYPGLTDIYIVSASPYSSDQKKALSHECVTGFFPKPLLLEPLKEILKLKTSIKL